MKHRPVCWLWVAACIVTGCATSHKLASARHTPCRASDVVITDRQRSALSEVWIAQCGEQRFACEARAQPDDRIVYHCQPAPVD